MSYKVKSIFIKRRIEISFVKSKPLWTTEGGSKFFRYIETLRKIETFSFVKSSKTFLMLCL